MRHLCHIGGVLTTFCEQAVADSLSLLPSLIFSQHPAYKNKDDKRHPELDACGTSNIHGRAQVCDEG